MRKTFKLEDLECANCAAKMERGIRAIEGVTYANMSFMTQKLTVEAPDEIFDDVMKKAAEICKKVEPDMRIIMK